MDERLRAVEKKLGMTRGIGSGHIDVSVEDNTSNDNNDNSIGESTLRQADSQDEPSSTSLTSFSHVSSWLIIFLLVFLLLSFIRFHPHSLTFMSYTSCIYISRKNKIVYFLTELSWNKEYFNLFKEMKT